MKKNIEGKMFFNEKYFIQYYHRNKKSCIIQCDTSKACSRSSLNHFLKKGIEIFYKCSV
jgi:hypothetical protein